MADFFMALGLAALLIFTVMAVVLGLVMRSLTRANRVAPGRRCAAPLTWLVSPRAPARLHRRLRRSVEVTDFAVGTVAPLAVPLRDVAGELVERAVTIDDWVVASARLHPEARRTQLAHLSAEVRQIEVSAARIHQISGDWRRCLDQATASVAAPLPDLHQRLDAVEAALQELPTAALAPAPGGTADTGASSAR